MGGYFGVQRVEYIGDTIIDGYNAQRLRETQVIAPWGSTNYTSYSNSSIYTRYADDIVYTWNWNDAFDTLCWFGAAPGQFWASPGLDDDPFYRITVLDTSTVVINGLALRQLIVQRGEWDWMPPDTLHERIGFTINYLNGWSWFLTDQPWNGLMCYSDADIDYVVPGVSDCGFTLSISDVANVRSTTSFPNPGSTHFSLSLSPGPHTITLFDATGRVVLQQRTADERPVINTERLPAGLYRITIRDKQGGMMGATWVKTP